ncbi:hypothetical protein [uncultured Mediterranean phage uvMED]|nr:hypothetical protein [uncultured Mediterranean phage uvMED]
MLSLVLKYIVSINRGAIMNEDEKKRFLTHIKDLRDWHLDLYTRHLQEAQKQEQIVKDYENKIKEVEGDKNENKAS